MAHDFVSGLENNKSRSGCLVFLHDIHQLLGLFVKKHV
jgi:hypothetical protein